ncbi:16289_t:CDS:2 [Funneliformis geosporum]|uniref:1733_t:CDS:1 n=1 Tax=Funneliformis geosporum TaxID=1117311 RepID=A0A9W4SJM4_9GLOM|nr:16289_t:CDS:2 [Funneliformis geosporum]CAI2172342.1 1733_t:CDS:2 [Funneliformis geosporum]
MPSIQQRNIKTRGGELPHIRNNLNTKKSFLEINKRIDNSETLKRILELPPQTTGNNVFAEYLFCEPVIVFEKSLGCLDKGLEGSNNKKAPARDSMSDINSDNSIESITVQVALRIRPLSAEELVNIPTRLQKNVISATPFTPNQVVVQGDKKRSYTFDHVFGPETTQKEIYDKAIMNLVDKFLEGNNVTLLAYGHTSSGKTYTIGTADNSSLTQEVKGMIPRSITTLFSCINSTQYKTRKFFMKISFAEIHKNELIDLLDEGCDIKLDEQKIESSTVLSGLQEIKVNSAEEVLGLLSLGQLHRRANTQDCPSENSHLIVTVTLSQQKYIPTNGTITNSNSSSNTPPSTPNRLRFGKNKSREDLRSTKQFEGDWASVTSKFHFVDLAGNEMEKGSFDLEDVLKEHFSTSDTTPKVAIGNMICALGDPVQNTKLLPYKNNKLTKVFRNYLGNNSQVLILACVSPAGYNIKETINTLDYAKFARSIKYTPSKTTYLEDEEEVIDNLESKFVMLKRSFSDLSKEYTKSTINEEMIDQNVSCSEEDTDNSTLVDNGLPSSTSDLMYQQISMLKQEDGKTFIKSVWPSFQKAVGPVIQEYEKSITSLENQLSLVRAALSHSETRMQTQERKLVEAEDHNEQSKRMISDLKYQISKICEREETTESYIKDLEAKLNSDNNEQRNEQNSMHVLKNRVEELKRNEENTEKVIRKLETRLEGSEAKNSKLSKHALQLEKDLHDKEDGYLSLIEQFEKQKNIDKEEKQWLLEEIENRDNRISQLEENVESLVKEIENMKKLKIVTTLSLRNTHSKSSSISSDSNVETPSYNQSDLRPTIKISEFPSVSNLESQLDDLQSTHERTIEELNDIQRKYKTCLAELKELRFQITDAKLEKFAKTMANSAKEEPLNNSDSLSTFTHPVKARSLSADFRGEEKAKITTASIIQKLQIELKQLEVMYADKNSGLDIVKQEFARLQLNYHESIEIVEELREEIKRRDALAQMEIMSGKNSELPYDGDYSETTSEIYQIELVQRLREEVEQLKDDQRKTLDILAEQEKIPNKNLITIIEKNITELKNEMNGMKQKYNENRFSTKVVKDDEAIRELQIRITTLEEQLVQTREILKESQIITDSSNDDSSDSLQIDQKIIISKLRNQVGKLQKEIVSKSHTIASILYPSIEYQNSVQKLEDELEDARQELERAIRTKDNNTVTRARESTDASLLYVDNPDEETTSDCLEQTSDDHLKELEDRVKDLETRLINTKDVPQDTFMQVPILNVFSPTQRSIEELQEKLDILQRELVGKSETIESLQVERDIVISLKEQLENLKAEIRSKHELIESMKKDLTINFTLEQKLRQKEAQTLNLKTNLLQVQNQEQSLQDEIMELRSRLANIENGDDVNKVLQSELVSLREELKNSRERETIATERLRVLKARLENDSEESLLQEQLNYLQNVEIMQKNRIISLEDRISKKGVQVDEYLVQLKTDLNMAKESKSSHIKTIEVLETKLKNVEHQSELHVLKQQIQELKLNESNQLQEIHSLEIKLNDQTSSDLNQIKQLLEEIKNILIREQKQEREFATITNSLKEFEDTRINSMRDEINELMDSKTVLCSQVQELQNKVAISEEQLLNFRSLQEEISYLKNLDNEQKNTIQELNFRFNQMRDSKDSAVKELMTLTESFNLQKEIVKFLESEMKSLKEELISTQENHITSTHELEKVTSLLDTTQKQYANEKKRAKVLEVEVETFKLVGDSGDKNINSLREALTNTKLELVAKNDMLTELESQMMDIENERDHHIKLSNELTASLDERESQHLESINELKSKIKILEGELVSAQELSKISEEAISSLEEKLLDMQSQLENAKNSDEEQSKFIKEIESKLGKANDVMIQNEDKLAKQNFQISELETVIQKTYLDLQTAKASEIEVKKNVEELESKLAKVTFKLQNCHSAAEVESVKDITEKQSIRIRELEELLRVQQEESMTENNLVNLTAELEKAKADESARIEFVKELETKLVDKNNDINELQQVIEFSNVELTKLHESETKLESKLLDLENQRIEISKLDETNKAAKIEDLTNKLHLAKSQIKGHLEEIAKLELKYKHLDSEKLEHIKQNEDLSEQLAELKMSMETISNEFKEAVSKYENADEFSKKQQKCIIDLETAIKGAKKVNTTREFEIRRVELSNSNDNLIVKIVELEARVTVLTNHNKSLQNELSKCDVDSLMEMKIKVKELQGVKDELENINETFLEECGKLEEKVQSLMKQLWTLGNDGNAMAQQVAELNDQIMNREKELAILKRKPTGYKELESEISRLLKENGHLKEEIKDLSAKAAKEINPSLISNLSERSNNVSKSDKDEVSKLLQHENTIAQQNNLIKSLQKNISELEQLLDESCRNTSVEKDNNANNQISDSFRMPYHSRPESAENSSQIAELLAEMQTLSKKMTKSESENSKNQQLIETLEMTLDESETSLQITKEELNTVLSQKQDLLRYISGLKDSLDAVEATKTEVETQKIHIEKALNEERKAKELSERARIALENRVEKLIAKKNKFMCF